MHKQITDATGKANRGRPFKNHRRVVLSLPHEINELINIGAEKSEVTRSEFVTKAVKQEIEAMQKKAENKYRNRMRRRRIEKKNLANAFG